MSRPSDREGETAKSLLLRKAVPWATRECRLRLSAREVLDKWLPRPSFPKEIADVQNSAYRHETEHEKGLRKESFFMF